jgi:hypothetical protein
MFNYELNHIIDKQLSNLVVVCGAYLTEYSRIIHQRCKDSRLKQISKMVQGLKSASPASLSLNSPENL